jgi:hypothetical protein
LMRPTGPRAFAAIGINILFLWLKTKPVWKHQLA